MSSKSIWLVAGAAVVSAIAIMPAAADETGFADAHSLRREGGRICMTDHYHYGNGSGRTQAAAQRDAVGSWQSFTAFEYGSTWARWSRAASRGANCSRSSSGYSCSISARPCK